MTPIKIEKKGKMSKFEIVKFQLMTHCFVEEIKLNDTEMTLLALLGTLGKVRLKEFCIQAVEMKVLGNTQAVNNCIWRIEKTGLVIKEGSGSKEIYLDPELDIQSEGTIILDYKFVKLESEETPRHNPANRERIPA